MKGLLAESNRRACSNKTRFRKKSFLQVWGKRPFALLSLAVALNLFFPNGLGRMTCATHGIWEHLNKSRQYSATRPSFLPQALRLSTPAMWLSSICQWTPLTSLFDFFSLPSMKGVTSARNRVAAHAGKWIQRDFATCQQDLAIPHRHVHFSPVCMNVFWGAKNDRDSTCRIVAAKVLNQSWILHRGTPASTAGIHPLLAITVFGDRETS